MTPVFEVTIRITREEEGLTKREYLGVDETGDKNDPYGPQVKCIKEVDRVIAQLVVGPYLDVPALIQAVLECSKMPRIETGDLRLDPGDLL